MIHRGSYQIQVIVSIDEKINKEPNLKDLIFFTHFLIVAVKRCQYTYRNMTEAFLLGCLGWLEPETTKIITNIPFLFGSLRVTSILAELLAPLCASLAIPGFSHYNHTRVAITTVILWSHQVMLIVVT